MGVFFGLHTRLSVSREFGKEEVTFDRDRKISKEYSALQTGE